MPTPASTPVRKRFDYDSLDTADALFIQRQTSEIWMLVKRTAESIVEIGQRLIEVKERLGHGRFGVWLKAEFKWDRRTAYRFMSVAEEFRNKSDKLSQLNIAPSALYLLAAPSTPASAKEEGILRAEAGESITYAVAKGIKQKHRLKRDSESVKQKSNLSQDLATGVGPSPLTSQSEPTSESASLSSSEQSFNKLEILAIQHREDIVLPPSRSYGPGELGASQAMLPVSKAVPQSNVSGQSGLWWRLGYQLLYCGNPNSPHFLGQISGEVKLLLAFPPIPGWQSKIEARTAITLATQWSPQGNDSAMFEDVMEQMLLLYSKLSDPVVGCFLSYPGLLSIANRLNRRGLFAEPNEERCYAAIALWKKAGLKVEQISVSSEPTSTF